MIRAISARFDEVQNAADSSLSTEVFLDACSQLVEIFGQFHLSLRVSPTCCVCCSCGDYQQPELLRKHLYRLVMVTTEQDQNKIPKGFIEDGENLSLCQEE